MVSREAFTEQQEFRLHVLEAMVGKIVSQNNDLDRTVFSPSSVSEDLAARAEDVSSAISYLEREKFVRSITDDAGYETLYKVTHQGIKEIERVHLTPERGTDRFPPQVIQNLNFHSSVGAVQTGPDATAYVTQNTGPDLSLIFALIEQLRQQADELSEDEQEEAQVDLDTLEAELKDRKEPKKIRVLTRRLMALGRGAEAAVGFGANATTLVIQAQALGLF